MSMRTKTCGGIVAGSMLFAATAWGQVAAPPLTPFSFVTENPAAIQWGSPSRVGAGGIQSQTVIVPSSPAQPNTKDNLAGGGGGARFVGQYVSAAGSYVHADNTNSPHSPQAEFSDDSEGALGLRLGHYFTVGVGQTSTLDRTFVAGQLVQERHDIPQYGLTARIGEWLFFGGSGGQDTQRHTDLLVPVNTFKATRDVVKYGAGIRTGGTVATHVEYYVVEFDKYAQKNLPAFTSSGRQTSSTAVAEFNFGGVLLGYAATHTVLDSNQPTFDTARLDLGWAPFSGLSVVARGDLTTMKIPQPLILATGIDHIETTTYSLLVSYLF